MRKPSGYWKDYDNNHREAMKYSSRVEYHNANSWACTVALEMGWLDEWFPRIDWDIKENCLEEAKKYSTRTEFARKNPTAYSHTRKNGWLDDCTNLKSGFYARSEAKSKPRKWINKETICAAAKECDSISEFQKKCPGAYVIAKEEGYLYELFESKKHDRTYERFLEIARNCTTKSQVEEKDASIVQMATKKGWWKDCPWIPEKSYSPRKWTDEARWDAALQCKTRSEYYERFNGAWNYDNEHNLLDRYTHFIKPVHEGRDPNAEDYVIYAYKDYINKVVYWGLTYDERKQRRHWEHLYGRRGKDGTTIYDAVASYWQSIGLPLPDPIYVMEGLHINDVGYYEGWYIDHSKEDGWKVLNIAPAGSTGGARVKWTYDTTFEEAHKYQTRSEFKKGNSPAYYKALRTLNEFGIPWIDTFYWLRDSHDVRSEASRKRQTGKKLSEEHKKNIGKAVKSFYANKKAS